MKLLLQDATNGCMTAQADISPNNAIKLPVDINQLIQLKKTYAIV